ncbi:MBL fold metallo-hydrolase [Arthrobacter sp. D3-16]
MLGTITRTIGRSVTIHTYTAPPAGTEVATQLVGLDDQILVVDTQYAIPFATEAANYAPTLGKPISGVYVTHAHPDHFFGSAEFDAPVYALQSVADELAATGDAVPDELTLPTHTVSPGTETISGVTYGSRQLIFVLVELPV